MYAVLSDIHGNLFALEKVVQDMDQFDIEGIILLGDLIDYCMQSNEVVGYVKEYLQTKIICSIWGNHEKAILTSEYDHFSSLRGVESAKNTAALLSEASAKYLTEFMDHDGMKQFEIQSKQILAVHGSLEDYFWKAISVDDVKGDYRTYDFVLSGHSHHSHFFTIFYTVDDPQMRNKRAVRFVNPGSVGQPRNHNPNAQYALIDFATGTMQLRAIEYDVSAAMKLFDGSVDDFYRQRLKTGV